MHTELQLEKPVFVESQIKQLEVLVILLRHSNKTWGRGFSHEEEITKHSRDGLVLK